MNLYAASIEQLEEELRRRRRIEESRECTGIAASWCPVCGDCTCVDPDDKNDSDCPLHSVESIHAEAGLAEMGITP